MENPDFNYEHFPVESTRGLIFINLHQLIYCKGVRSYTSFEMINKKESFVSSYPLSIWEQRLPALLFFRISKFYILNKEFAVKYEWGKDGRVTLKTHEHLTVSRLVKKAFLKSIGWVRKVELLKKIKRKLKGKGFLRE